MKKIYKTVSLLFLCAVIASLPILLVACNKDDISRYYGEYTAETDYYSVAFWLRGESKDRQLFDGDWDVVAVGKNGFTYIDRKNNNQYAEKECDAFLLKSLKRLMKLMGEKATLRDGVIFLNDSGLEIKYDNVYDFHSFYSEIYCMYYKEISVGDIRYKVIDNYYADPTFYVSLYDDYVIDEHGVEWEVTIGKTFILN